ncbi:uncharacterized protein LOC131876055 [Cryptomeria japonica]|uniref:uncharacterized protein LOC131876055 n=1 Tax=Cryptomeria japonica TaxID=3369 RepID=UPI0027DA1155|nr:uncharacterized protein LOC131876055 [Cryptomeria japonica]
MALSGGPWMFGKSSLSLRIWSPNMELNDSFFESALVWVRLPGLPLEFWLEDVFSGIANSFGELVAIDSMTAARKRLVYGRICVSISQNMDLPSSIKKNSKLGKWEQSIEFESLPFVCFSCKKAGHWAKACPSNPKNVQKHNNHVKQIWKEKSNKNEDGKEEGGSGVPSNSNDMKKDDRRASPSKDSSQKEEKHNKDKGFEIKTTNRFEVLQSQEVENISIEENLEEGEIDNTNESQHEALKDKYMKNNKVCPEVFEGQEVIVGKKMNFGSP